MHDATEVKLEDVDMQDGNETLKEPEEGNNEAIEQTEKEYDLNDSLQRLKSTTKKITTHMEIENNMKLAMQLTYYSCCFFAPCTIPYICYNQKKLSDLHRADQSDSEPMISKQPQ